MSKNTNNTDKLFENYDITVVTNNGINRHFKFRHKYTTMAHWFDLITFEDGLTVDSDIGCYTFYYGSFGDIFNLFRSTKDEEISLSYFHHYLSYYFDDFYTFDFNHRFKLCCDAIKLGIRKFDGLDK